MAYKKNYKRRRSSRKNYSALERKSYRKGFLAGLFASKKKSRRNSSNSKRTLASEHKRYREHNLGALLFNGKLYDTNFKDGPHEISKDDLAWMHKEYGFDRKLTDKEAADAYVRHMRRKYGAFDKKTGKWLGLLSDLEK